jgi:hypothetical protein
VVYVNLSSGTGILGTFEAAVLHCCNLNSCARYEALTAVAWNLTVFWNVTLCNLLETYQFFGGLYCFLLQCGKEELLIFEGRNFTME